MDSHDNISFQELKSIYSFGQTSDRRELFSNIVAGEVARRTNPVVLDIGCGSGMGVGERKQEFVHRIRKHCSHLVGIEPDESVQRIENLHDEIHHCLFEDTPLEENSIDVAYSHFVMEHVEDPDRFMEKLNFVLKPGGVYLFITPNGKSYFVLMTKFFSRLKIVDWLLPKLKGYDSVADYHYPVFYKFNHEKEIVHYGEIYGFDSEIAYYERHGAKSYFPSPFGWMVSFFNWKRKIFKNPKCLINLLGKLQKRS